jgi:hypothetical protein
MSFLFGSCAPDEQLHVLSADVRASAAASPLSPGVLVNPSLPVTVSGTYPNGTTF